jgi:dynein cytoplasmic 1 intermediate chain
VYVYVPCDSQKGASENYVGHHGPITGLDFHPRDGSVDFSDLFLSSATDWSCKLWSSKSPSNTPLWSFEHSDYVSDVGWYVNT